MHYSITQWNRNYVGKCTDLTITIRCGLELRALDFVMNVNDYMCESAKLHKTVVRAFLVRIFCEREHFVNWI